MTLPTAARASRRGEAATATATAVLVAAGAAGWSWLLGRALVGVAPLAAVAAVAAVAVLVASGRLSGRLAGGLLALWLPAAVWAAGTPAGQLLPWAWPVLVAQLGRGAQRLTALAGAPTAIQPWLLAVWLLGAGVVWVAGAILASGPASVRRRAIAFGVLVAPWIAAVIVGAVVAHHNDLAAWQGAAILLAGLLWFVDRRVAVRSAVALGLVAALVSVAVAQAVGPRTRWFNPASPVSSTSSLRFLDTEPTYGPLQGRRSGATMLEVTAAQPALWRMRVLTLFAGPGWRIGYPPGELPQPAAEPIEIQVRVRGLRNDLVVAPGQVDTVHADDKISQASQASGEAWQLTSPPRHGDTYQVRASVVRATAQQLHDAPAPADPRLQFYTRLTPGYDAHSIDVPLFGQPPDPQVIATLERTPYGSVAALARQLAFGARNQWEVVARVHRYLLDGDRFRYTTNLPEPGLYPLVDFLLHGHAGDCQHFAGAAALLLRLAGVPARVVTGFATGMRQGAVRFEVRDVDAHSWIEVYFQGYGWVAFNPTPAAAQAQIPRQLDPLASATTTGRHGGHGGPSGPGGLAIDAILVALATAGVCVARRHARLGPVPLGLLLEGLVGHTGGHIQPSSTLAELGVELVRLVGPQTAALAVQAERAQFAPDAAVPVVRPRIQIARALAKDLGPMRMLIVLVRAACNALP
jgi:Transglutaminase-like superfamily